jgi:hypothetical protein
MDISIIAVIIAAVSLAASIIQYFQNKKLQKRLDKLTSGLSDKNLEQVVHEYVNLLNKCGKDIDTVNEEFKQIRKDTAKFYNKVGLVRFQAFKDTGGDQSFSLAMLNEYNDGFLISSLHGRGFAKIYAKDIQSGKSPNYKLTDEEAEALEKAIKS